MRNRVSHSLCGVRLQLCILTMLSVVCLSSSLTGIPQVSGRYPAQYYARLEEEIDIPCPVTDALFVSWFKDGAPVNENSDIRIRSSGQFKLIIRSVKQEDAGIYSCSAVNGNGPLPNRLNFTLVVLNKDDVLPDRPTMINPGEVAPTFVNNPPGEALLQLGLGTNHKLKCRAEGNPRPRIEWYKDGRLLHPSLNAQFEGFSLRLSNLRIGDSGRYMCKVENNLGSITFMYTISVSDRQTAAEVVPPYPPLNTSVTYGEPASLQCRVKSQSKPTIKWLRQVPTEQEGAIKLNEKYYLVVKDEMSVIETEPGTYLNTLYISSVRYEDSGMYVCSGINQRGGSDKREAYITVVPATPLTTTKADVETESSWEYTFGSPPATLAVIISIPVVIFLIIAIAVIYRLNRRKKTSNIRRPPHPMLHEHEASVPLNMNANNAAYNGHKLSNGEVFSYSDKLYQPSTYPAPMVASQQYSQYSQSDGSYRSAVIYPPPPPPQATVYSSQHSYVDIPDTDSHFSSVSHTRPQYMSSSNHYDRDIQSDPAHSRISHHHCPPPPPSSYYSEQW